MTKSILWGLGAGLSLSLAWGLVKLKEASRVDAVAVRPAVNNEPLTAQPSVVQSARVRVHEGLTEDDVRTFYHLSQGSEFVPYCALKQLRPSPGEKPFVENFERYGLIPDARGPGNELGLPIGVTRSGGLLDMIGFNCAACHVATIYSDPTYEIVGAPGHFDVRRFFDELTPRMQELMKDRNQKMRLIGCMLEDRLELPEIAPMDKLDAEEAVELLALQHAVGSDSNGENEPSTAATIIRDQLRSDLDQPPGAGLGANLESEPPLPPLVAHNLDGSRGASSAADRLTALQRRRVVRTVLSRYRRGWRLLTARMSALNIVAAVGNIPYTPPGPGRVDAFITAVNLMRPDAELPMDSPVAYPPLFGLSTVVWRHFDGNTDTAMQRNMGQAIGLGGVFAYDMQRRPPQFLGSSLRPKELAWLEAIADKIRAPRWPFAQPEPWLVLAGKGIYERECAGCHEPTSAGMPEPPPHSETMTDNKRLVNFAQRLRTGEQVVDVLRKVLGEVESAAPAELRDREPNWRAPDRYGVRPLHGVWATAPYLHNNSVPTLEDLLLPEADRPLMFTVDYSRYDTEKVGCALRSGNPPQFDAGLPGNSNAGHRWGTTLPGPDKRALLAYLKQL